MTRPLSVHQFHYSATSGDAVTNQMLFLQKSLKEVGIGGDIFAVERKGGMADTIRRFSREHVWNCDLFLVHHSHGNPALDNILKLEIPKALVYHNITPAEFYRHDPYIATLCELGRNQLPLFREHSVGAFADSRFNAQELVNMGFPAPQLLPLFEMGALVENITPRALAPSEPVNLLFVGRIAPHKNQALLIESFFYLKQLLPRHSKLILVGSGDPVYAEYLRLLTKQLGLVSSVTFTGKVSQKELIALYESAHAFVCTSQHEGFCIPLVEAMKHSLPVFYLPTSGVAETMGNVGTPLAADPKRIALCIQETLRSVKKVQNILTEQTRRLHELQGRQSALEAQAVLSRFLKQFLSIPTP